PEQTTHDYLSVSQPWTEGPAAAPLNQYKELWSPTKPPQPPGHTPCRPMPGTFRDSGPSSLKVRHWKTRLAGAQYVYWCPYPQLRAHYKRQTTNSHHSLSPCRISLSWTYNSSNRVRVSRTDDTDLNGAQVPGQTSSTNTRVWLTQNLGHPTEEVTATHTHTTCTLHKPHETSRQPCEHNTLVT
ncbi:hypothetical protein Taro_036450, partial [Colocasia esculenta]|nr:hypothetical protein [Colocasia esculenta]